MSRDNKFNHIKYSVIAIFIVTLSGVPAYFFWHSKKAAAVTEQKTKAETEQDFALAADKLFANKKITEIKTMKHIWELAPLVGKDIQLYGRIVFYSGYKNERGVFYINGNFNVGIPSDFSKEQLRNQGITLIQKEDYLISPFMVVSGKVTFNYLDMSILENTEYSDETDVPGGHWCFAGAQIVKIYASPPPEAEHPTDVSLSASQNKYSKEQFNYLFYGIINDADIITFARYISILKQQKEAELKSDKKLSIQSVNSAFNLDDSKLDEVYFLLDLIPYVGSEIELKGKIEETGDNKHYIVLNDKVKILLSIHYSFIKNAINKTVIIRGNLAYFYSNSKKPLNASLLSSSDTGGLILLNTKDVKILSEKEIHDILLPCVKKNPDLTIWRARKSFITGFYQDADEISFRNFIINMMKEDAAEKNNPHRSR